MRNIKPINNNGSIQIKFRYDGQRFCFNPIPGADFNSKDDLKQVEAIALRIANDLLVGNFDRTLTRYKIGYQEPRYLNDLLQVWDLWVNSLESSTNHHQLIRQMILRTSPKVSDTRWFTSYAIAPQTFNNRLGYLKRCFKWAKANGLVTNDPYNDLKSRKVVAQIVKPFTTDEINKILTAFKDDHYYPFVCFLFATGCRISEAIGIRWENVDLTKDMLIISESLSPNDGDHCYTRVCKPTKGRTVRYLNIDPVLKAELISLRPTSIDPNALVFRTKFNKVISDNNFRILWRSTLERANVPYRKIHNIRHTTLSMAIEQGIPLTGIAYLAGHTTTKMIITTYGHMINRPQLPQVLH